MIINDNGGCYMEKEDSTFLPTSDRDLNYVNIKVTNIINVGKMQFIYIAPTDAHVRMSMGPIVYSGDSVLGAKVGDYAKYINDGDRIDFEGWSLVRDEKRNWVVKKNNAKAVVEKQVKSGSGITENYNIKKTEPDVILKPKELVEAFRFYYEAFCNLSEYALKINPAYKKEWRISRNKELAKYLESVLFVVQDFVESGQFGTKINSLYIRDVLQQKGVPEVNGFVIFIKKMICAYNGDKGRKVINADGEFIDFSEKSNIMKVELFRINVNADKSVTDKITDLVRLRKVRQAEIDIAAAQNVVKKRRGRPPKQR